MPEPRLRFLVASPGEDRDERRDQALARALADAGHEVVYTGGLQSPEMIAATATQEGVDAIGLVIPPGTHMQALAALARALTVHAIADLIVFGSGEVPDEDLPALAALGITKVFPASESADAIAAWAATRVRSQEVS